MKNRITMGHKSFIANAALRTIIATLLVIYPTLVIANEQPSAAIAEVKIENYNFTPKTLNVPVGTKVTWTNRDDVPHTVVSANGIFKSKVRDENETFSYTFAKAGVYTYHCSVHPKMTGKVVVQ